MRFQRKVCTEFLPHVMSHLLFMYSFPSLCRFFSFSPTGSDGAASSYHVKQLEEQNGRLKEALVRSVKCFKAPSD